MTTVDKKIWGKKPQKSAQLWNLHWQIRSKYTILSIHKNTYDFDVIFSWSVCVPACGREIRTNQVLKGHDKQFFLLQMQMIFFFLFLVGCSEYFPVYFAFFARYSHQPSVRTLAESKSKCQKAIFRWSISNTMNEISSNWKWMSLNRSSPVISCRSSQFARVNVVQQTADSIK